MTTLFLQQRYLSIYLQQLRTPLIFLRWLLIYFYNYYVVGWIKRISESLHLEIHVTRDYWSHGLDRTVYFKKFENIDKSLEKIRRVTSTVFRQVHVIHMTKLPGSKTVLSRPLSKNSLTCRQPCMIVPYDTRQSRIAVKSVLKCEL